MISTRFTKHSLVTEAQKTLLTYQKNAHISVDATMGNGHDTDFLARHSHHVYAFDVQEPAILNTLHRLQASKQAHKVTLVHDGHESMTNYLPQEDNIDIFMFNLGYLPQSDNTVIMTQTKSTLQALEIATSLLSKTGIISIIAYPGHTGGKTELTAIQQWLQSLNDSFAITHIHSLQETEDSPRLYTLTRV